MNDDRRAGEALSRLALGLGAYDPKKAKGVLTTEARGTGVRKTVRDLVGGGVREKKTGLGGRSCSKRKVK